MITPIYVLSKCSLSAMKTITISLFGLDVFDIPSYLSNNKITTQISTYRRHDYFARGVIRSLKSCLSWNPSPFHGGFPSQRPVARSFGVFFDLRPKRLSKQSRRRWFETPFRLLWRRCNAWPMFDASYQPPLLLLLYIPSSLERYPLYSTFYDHIIS